MVSVTTANSGVSASASADGDPLVPRLLLGTRLRRLREDRGISQEDAARTSKMSSSKLSRLELGRSGFELRDVTDLLTTYGVHDDAELSTMLVLAEQTNARAWWHDYRDIVQGHLRHYLSAEHIARLLRCFEYQHIPPLLQTEAYTRELIRREVRDAELQRHIDLRGRRLRILKSPRPVNLWAVLDEAALLRRVGDLVTMRAQLEHIIKLCWRPNVTVQIAPLGIRDRVKAGDPLTLVRFRQQDLLDMAFLERSETGVYPTRPAEIEHHWHIFNTLVTEAAPPERTPQIVNRVLDTL